MPNHASKTKLTRLAKKYMAMLGIKTPVPKFEIVERLAWHWIARTTFQLTGGKSNSLIQIQRGATVDKQTIERIVAHEVIHHVHHVTMSPLEQFYTNLSGIYDGHGSWFSNAARLIGAKVGQKDFVTAEYNDSYKLGPMASEIWVLVARRRVVEKGKTVFDFGMAWCDRMSPAVKQRLKKFSEKQNLDCKLVKTSDLGWLSGPHLAEAEGTVGVPDDSIDGGRASLKLLELYESAPASAVLPKTKPKRKKPRARLGKRRS